MIHKATEDDIPEIRSLMQSVPGFWQQNWRADTLERSIRSADGLAYVWTDHNRIVGFVCAHDLGFRGYLSELLVANEYRNRGIGKQLLRQVEQELSTQGCTVLIADVWKNSEKFYRNLGWSPPDVILLRRKLSE